jgi:uncharacterized protein YegJ (DUF2314 family)
MKNALPPALMVVLLIAMHCSAQTINQRAKVDQITSVSKEDPEMLKAFGKAKATLDEFLKLHAAPPPGTSGYAVKVGIDDGKGKGNGNGKEFFWLNSVSRQGEKFEATINNKPRIVKNVRLGQRYSFARDEIVDWMYTDEKAGRMKGNFTACAILTHEPPAEAAKFKANYGLECEK